MRDYLETLPRVHLERTAAGGARERAHVGRDAQETPIEVVARRAHGQRVLDALSIPESLARRDGSVGAGGGARGAVRGGGVQRDPARERRGSRASFHEAVDRGDRHVRPNGHNKAFRLIGAGLLKQFCPVFVAFPFESDVVPTFRIYALLWRAGTDRYDSRLIWGGGILGAYDELVGFSGK